MNLLCQLVEMEPSVLSQPRSLCDLETCVCFLHQDLEPIYINTSALLLFFSYFRFHSTFPSLSLSSSELFLSLSLSLFTSFLLSALHTFPEHLFPPGSQATKYSDWCRQLGLITNGKRSRAAQYSSRSVKTSRASLQTACIWATWQTRHI